MERRLRVETSTEFVVGQGGSKGIVLESAYTQEHVHTQTDRQHLPRVANLRFDQKQQCSQPSAAQEAHCSLSV
jgi:hypothetical protein